jgi:hypothetical protein
LDGKVDYFKNLKITCFESSEFQILRISENSKLPTVFALLPFNFFPTAHTTCNGYDVIFQLHYWVHAS